VIGVAGANASGSTLAHMLKLQAIAKGYPQSETISRWIELCMMMKTAKLAIGGGQAGEIASAVLGVGAGVAKVGVKLTMTKVVLRTSAETHRHTVQEQAISRQSKAGPASRIADELFTRRASRASSENTMWIAASGNRAAGWRSVTSCC
jgi:hypothetical protein